MHARNCQYLILESVNIIMYYLDTVFRILILFAIVSVDYCSSFLDGVGYVFFVFLQFWGPANAWTCRLAGWVRLDRMGLGFKCGEKK